MLTESATPDMQALFASGSFAPGPTRKLDTKPGMTSGIWQMRPESRGHVLARSKDPRVQPSINPNYLAEDRDQRSMVAGLRLIRDWFNQPSPTRHVVAETVHGPDVQSDDEILDYIRNSGATVYHPIGTFKRGTEYIAVVDPHLKMLGLPGIRVIAASVMPRMVSANTNAATLMIAEKGADMVKASIQ